MKKEFVVVLSIFILLSFTGLFVPVTAEVINGSVTESGWISTHGVSPHAGGLNWFSYDSIYTTAIQNLYGFHILVKFSDVPARMRFDVPSTSSAQTTVTGTIGTTTIFTGTIGYTNSYDILGNLVGGYEYVETSNWNNLHGYTGIQSINLSYDKTALYHWEYEGWSGGYVELATGGACFGTGVPAAPCVASGSDGYITNKEEDFWNGYSIESPVGIGMHGVIEKNDGTKTYPSQVFVYNATSGAIITSQNGTSLLDFTFDIFTTPIIIGVTTSKPSHVNSSILFAPAIPTVTPTPTGPPAGYVRTRVYAKNGNTGGLITGATLSLRDVENSTWVNGTSSSVGLIIDVLIGHTIDVYGSYPGIYSPSQELGAIPGGDYNLPLYPYTIPPPVGKVNLMVAVYDSSTGYSLSGVNTYIFENGTGITDTRYTGAGGTATFLVTNNTIITITASKSGYISGSKSISSGSGADVFTIIDLTRLATATPTPYIPPTLPIIPTVSGTPGPGGNYTGFWGPLANGLESAGVLPSYIGITLTALFVFFGFCVGGWSGSAYSPGAPFNGMGSIAGGAFGFLISCAFGFIPLSYVIAIIMIGVFLFIFFPKGG